MKNFHGTMENILYYDYRIFFLSDERSLQSEKVQLGYISMESAYMRLNQHIPSGVISQVSLLGH